jgi:hypothetical protein
MSNRVTLGGERLGSGKKMKVELHGYERSTHDLSYICRTTMAAGTLVPFMKKVGLPGDTFDIDLDVDIQTHPTVGPLFGSFKIQLDVFTIPLRLYNSLMHNNKINIGMTMNKVLLPVIELITQQKDLSDVEDIDNAQINPSCILKYLGISGIGQNDYQPDTPRTFQITPLLGYWDIYKNYYANKQENVGYVIHNGVNAGGAVTTYFADGNALPSSGGIYLSANSTLGLQAAGATIPNLEYQLYRLNNGTTIVEISLAELGTSWVWDSVLHTWQGRFNAVRWNQVTVYSGRVATSNDSIAVSPTVTQFPLENIDEMREEILAYNNLTVPFKVNNVTFAPYNYVAQATGLPNKDLLASQEGLGIKTYQSDLFNNWLRTEFIDGPSGINALTAIDTSSGEFTINQLLISRKIYDVMNRVMVSGGSFRDWLGAVWDKSHDWIPETPIYEGGLIKELAFQEVISNSQSETQPLGTLGGRGVMTQKHKGGKVIIKLNEPCYIMGIISLTPRIGYSQGNDWDTYALQTMDDLHKPGMDQIGFEDLITEGMAWWDTEFTGPGGGTWIQQSAGKQPAWINYMTSVNKHYGNFAIANNEMFMVLDRKYEYNGTTNRIADLTTYIDPVKYNQIFAQTSLDAMNFWVSIGVKIEARRLMSAKIMPNL